MLKEVKGESVTEVPIMLVGNKKDEDQVTYFADFLVKQILVKDLLYSPFGYTIYLWLKRKSFKKY